MVMDLMMFICATLIENHNFAIFRKFDYLPENVRDPWYSSKS